MKKMLTNARALAPVFSPEAEMPLCLYDYVCRDFLRHCVSRQLHKSLYTTYQSNMPLQPYASFSALPAVYGVPAVVDAAAEFIEPASCVRVSLYTSVH